MKPNPQPPHPPKYLTDFYTITARDWQRWLRIQRNITAIAKQGFDALEEYFHRCAKNPRLNRSGLVSAGRHSTSAMLTLWFFEWATFTRRDNEYSGTHLWLDREYDGSDFRTIAEASYG